MVGTALRYARDGAVPGKYPLLFIHRKRVHSSDQEMTFFNKRIDYLTQGVGEVGHMDSGEEA
jgi:hypothetical protein